jgi:hypothetical protein
VKIAGYVSGLGKTKHPEFAFASGEMNETEFALFLHEALTCHEAFSADGAVQFICMDWRHIETLLNVGRKVYSDLLNICVWAKSNAGMGSLYRSQHELVAVFKVGTAPHLNAIELGKHGRHRSNLWTYAGGNTFKPGRMQELKLHPTVKPVGLVADAIRDVTRRGDLVLDGFAGSGTIFIAAERAGRAARAIEIDPHYVDRAILRWQKTTGGAAVHVETGLTFEALKAKRTTKQEKSLADAALSSSSTELAYDDTKEASSHDI